jgi:hypothetical protein
MVNGPSWTAEYDRERRSARRHPRLLRDPGNALIELRRHARGGRLLRQRDIFGELGIAEILGRLLPLHRRLEAVHDDEDRGRHGLPALHRRVLAVLHLEPVPWRGLISPSWSRPV